MATLLSTINAGAIPLCGDIDYKKYKIECEDIARICINDSWTAYTNRYVLIDLKKYYEKVCDLDFIFPTEAILHFLIKDYAESNENILYILHTDIFTNITIFKNKKLLFSSRFIYQNDEDVDAIDEEDVKDIIQESKKEKEELEDVLQLEEANENDLLDDDLDDLDSLEDIDSEELNDFEDFEETQPQTKAKESKKKPSFSRRDQLLCEFVKHSINDFYKNELYDSGFIQHVKIFNYQKDENGYETLYNYIIDELFIECNLEDVDLEDVLCDMSINELEN